MLQSAPPTSLAPGDVPEKLIGPRSPFVFAFALGDAPILPQPITSGEVAEIAVHHGAPSSLADCNWFAARMPAIRPVTGPLAITGVRPGDRIELEVLTVECEDPAITGPVRVTVAIAGSEAGHADGPVQVMVPASSAVRLKAGRPGGLLSIGPVVSRQPKTRSWQAIAARVRIRCTVLTLADK